MSDLLTQAKAEYPEAFGKPSVKITCLRGYSGSGKSTKAAEIAKETGAAIVCRDDLRKMLLGQWWTGKKGDEDRVTVAEEAQVIALLKSDTSVVVDATHLHPAYLRRWARLATRLAADFQVVDVRTNFASCQANDAARAAKGERSVGAKVISDQVKRFPMDKWPTITADPPFVVERAIWRPGLPRAVIFDLDGTVAIRQGRSPYDYGKVKDDACDTVVRDLVNMYHSEGYPTFAVSGRDDTCRQDTLDWLDDYSVLFTDLFMRDTKVDVDSRGNKLRDVEVKYRIFNEQFRDKFNIQFAVDDRDQVVRLWRDLGVKCFQADYGDF